MQPDNLCPAGWHNGGDPPFAQGWLFDTRTRMLLVCSVTVRVRSFHFLDWYQALPPGIKGDPVAVVAFIARSPLTNFDAVHGMNFPD